MSNNIFLLEDMHHGAVAKKTSVVLPPTQVAAQQNVFAEAMLEATSAHQKRHPLKWAVSLGAHVAVLTLLLLLPLYFSQGLDLHRFNTMLLTAPPPPAAAPPPPPPATAPRVVHSMPKTFTPGRLTAPSFVPKTVAVAAPADSAPPEVAFAGVPGGVPGGIAGGQVGGILGSMGPAAPTPVAAVSEGPRAPVRIGGDVKPPRLVSGPAPVYPMIARQAHIQGTVVIDAIIDEHGNVIQERALSGPPLLIQAAMQAVSQRKYEPTVLDGQATPVDLRIEVNFHTGG
jgi:periplasmic protein TonB